MDFDLFKKEKDVIEKAEQAIAEIDQDLSPFKELLAEYKKLSKSTQRLIKHSDRNEQKLRAAKDQITQQKEELERRQQELVRAEKLASLGQLVSGVAHELNTPLGIILTSASAFEEETAHLENLIKNAKARKSDVAKYMESAKEISTLLTGHSQNAADLIQSFKAVAVDRHVDDLRDIQLGDYVNDIVASLAPALKGSNIQIDVSIDDDLGMVTYPGALNQIITNLILNAKIHAFANPIDQPCIQISAALEQDRVTIRVKDNGCGVTDDKKEQVFDPFYTTARDQGGSGLGLHIVHNLVTAKLEGHLDLRDNPSGQGCCFQIDLPQEIKTKGMLDE
ncbi:HAMP domain-containing sensor histidine kinase [Terasakiella sp. A23]|uniref:sensor histidine kinase n=1 Tax=Terasakiella sp. FCG-A23 TaxID=3080561 RepID=UPI002952BECC|nr:HAMP domain-containing sensor histidine kinase [Terasakiella sp. A23]MDV7339621.1 HAMP domain-containing sensor histidine kinase [Terasakiella sp. A23]